MKNDQQAAAIGPLCDDAADQEEDHGRSRQCHVCKAKRQAVQMEVIAAGDQVGEQDHLQAEGHEPAALDHQVGGQFDLYTAAQAFGAPVGRRGQKRGASAERFAHAADG